MSVITLNALIVIYVHCKNVIEKLLQSDTASSVDSFDWQMQLRYYFNRDDEIITVKCVQTSYPIGYEYLGNLAHWVATREDNRRAGGEGGKEKVGKGNRGKGNKWR